jgi:uncharacterized protein (DUF1800 family)
MDAFLHQLSWIRATRGALAVVMGAALFSSAMAADPYVASGAATPDEAAHLLNRIAFGPRPGDLDQVMRLGVNRYIDQQLYPERIPLPPELVQRLASLTDTNETAGQLVGDFRQGQKLAKRDGEDGKEKRKQMLRELVEQSAEARLSSAVDSPRQLEEVLVDFWYNHFNVFSGKGLDRVLVTNYERDAIRPYVLGHFRDLLGATAHHPAMLFYLDNWLSTVPGYEGRGGAQGKASGLNENYARELMELHTLGVDGGYTQKDVTELARMLTGWTFDPRDNQSDAVYRFDDKRHDWGEKTWLGYHVAARGEAEGEWALDVLAASPVTAHHLSYELAQYFVSDDPPEALVKRMTERYLATRGDLRAVMYVMLKSREFQVDGLNKPKFKTPFEYVVSTLRASGVEVNNPRPLLGVLNQLGEPLYGCQTPDGYKNTETAWLNPDAMTRRIDFATVVAAGRLPVAAPPPDNRQQGGDQRRNAAPVGVDQLLVTLGPIISDRTRATVAASDPALRSALVLGSPDFMGR